jgi:hypothetical protein
MDFQIVNRESAIIEFPNKIDVSVTDSNHKTIYKFDDLTAF